MQEGTRATQPVVAGTAGPVHAGRRIGMAWRPRITTAWLAWRRSLVIGVGAAAGLVLLAELVGLVAAYGSGFPIQLQHHPESALGIWRQWDTIWFINIVEHGYAATHVSAFGGSVTRSAAAFPPGYPAAMAAVSWVLHISPLAAGVLISGIATVALLIGLHRLALLDESSATAERTVFLLLVYPAAFFLVIAYADSLPAAAAVWAFYAARHRRWFAAGALTAVATVTKIDAAVLVIPIAVEYMSSASWRWRRMRGGLVAVVALPAAALAGIAVYFQVTLRDPFAFVTAQAAWGHTLARPWSPLVQGIQNIVNLQAFHTDKGIPNTLDLATYGLLFVTTIYAIRAMRRSYAVFMVLMLVLLGVNGTLTSTERHLLLVFPMFIALARISQRSLWIERGLAVVGLPLLVYGTARFATGHWAN